VIFCRILPLCIQAVCGTVTQQEAAFIACGREAGRRTIGDGSAKADHTLPTTAGLTYQAREQGGLSGTDPTHHADKTTCPSALATSHICCPPHTSVYPQQHVRQAKCTVLRGIVLGLFRAWYVFPRLVSIATRAPSSPKESIDLCPSTVTFAHLAVLGCLAKWRLVLEIRLTFDRPDRFRVNVELV
jgi:hypothetical protein